MFKKLSTLWRFLLPVLVVLMLAPLILTQQQANQQIQNVTHDASEQAKSLVRLISVSDILVNEQADAAMRLLLERSNALGTPSIATDSVVIQGQALPNLRLGDSAPSQKNAIILDTTNTVGGTATLFVKSGNDFIRIATNVISKDGKRAVGTKLDPNGKAIMAIRENKPFRGVVDILGEPYITRYEPMHDIKGEVIGIWYVGYKVDMQVIREAIEKSRFLNSGFVALVDKNKHVRLASKHKTLIEVENFLKAPPQDWQVVSEKMPNWDVEVLVAYPSSEANKIGWSKTIVTFLQGAFLALVIFALILWQLRRLIFNPIGADPAVAIEVVQRIASGNFEKDNLKAKPGTLMANVLTMRRKLRSMVATLQQNAERLTLSANVVEHTHNGIFITDTHQRIIEINPSFTDYSGYTREDALGKTPEELFFACDDPLFFKHVWQSKESAGDWRGETKNKRKDGSIYPAKLDLFVVRDETGDVNHYVGVFSDITETITQRANLEHLAYHDPLTELPNRALFTDRLTQALAQISRSNGMLAVCYFDLDDFKEVNDTLGHDAGDQLLVELAQRLRSCLRESDTIARMGGDEFALLLCGLSSIEECKLTLDRLLEAINAPFYIKEKNSLVSASIGYTIYPLDDSAPDTLLRHADQAMYQIKIAGGRSYHLFDAELDRLTRGQVQTRSKIETALSNNEFQFYYQPKIDMRRGSIFSFEALIRWQQPDGSILMPSDFLPQVEHTDFIIDIGEWGITTALQQLSKWHEVGLDTRISVNIGARHLTQANFTERLSALLHQFPRVSPKRLMLEITETAIIDDISTVTATMASCKQLGVSFALDDFGVGYSSLTYLRRLPVDMIKIDQSFVRDMLDDHEDLTLIAGVISLSREFGRQVIAEGVESAEHGLQLMRMGCHIAQGYGIAKPMEASNVVAWASSYKMDERWKLWV